MSFIQFKRLFVSFWIECLKYRATRSKVNLIFFKNLQLGQLNNLKILYQPFVCWATWREWRNATTFRNFQQKCNHQSDQDVGSKILSELNRPVSNCGSNVCEWLHRILPDNEEYCITNFIKGNYYKSWKLFTDAASRDLAIEAFLEKHQYVTIKPRFRICTHLKFVILGTIVKKKKHETSFFKNLSSWMPFSSRSKKKYYKEKKSKGTHRLHKILSWNFTFSITEKGFQNIQFHTKTQRFYEHLTSLISNFKSYLWLHFVQYQQFN